MVDLSPEDAKLVVLARAARARVGAATGAAVRDETGRTYAGADVLLEAFALTSVQLAVAQAVAAGAQRVEALAVISADGSEPDSEAAAELGCVVVIQADPAGTVRSVRRR